MIDRRYISTLVLLPILVGLAGCQSTRSVPDKSPVAHYQAAIADAQTTEPSEIVTTLTPLVPHNDELVWRTTRDSGRQVLVVTWGGSETLPDAEAGTAVTVDEDVWVTVTPTIQEFCQGMNRSGDALVLRLAQRLGLPPDVDYDRFVELWVRPADLVRPCPDPEVSDRECELSTPVPTDHVHISKEHRTWFRTLKRTSYEPDGYPFTGLGYTYDWNPDADEVGPSEFVLRTGGTARVKEVESTGAYCRIEP